MGVIDQMAMPAMHSTRSDDWLTTKNFAGQSNVLAHAFDADLKRFEEIGDAKVVTKFIREGDFIAATGTVTMEAGKPVLGGEAQTFSISTLTKDKSIQRKQVWDIICEIVALTGLFMAVFAACKIRSVIVANRGANGLLMFLASLVAISPENAPQ